MPSSPSPLLAFWPFASAWMLLWGLAAAAPILIHLLSRRKYQQTPWAAMEYLLAALRKNARRIQFEQWLLLAVRTLILLVLALALADPILSSLYGLGGGLRGERTHFVFVLDGSFSMGVKRDDQTLFDSARELARQIVDDSRQGDGFTLIVMGDRPQVVIRDPAFDPRDVRQELADLQLPHGGGNLGAALAEVETLVTSGREKHKRLAETHICFFTDLGRQSWAEVETGENRGRLARLAEKATLQLFDLGQSTSGNLTIASLACTDPLVAVDRRLAIQAEVQNLSAQDRSGVRLYLSVDGATVAEQSLNISAQGQATARFSHSFSVPGEHQVQVWLDDSVDSLSIDNHRFLSLPVREAIRVLCIRGKPGGADHIVLALRPEGLSQWFIEPEVQSETALLEDTLSRYDAIFLCNVERYSENEAAMLHQYAAAGGGLVFFLGDQVMPENYNQLLGPGSQHPLLPLTLESLADASGYRLNPLEYEHPLIAPYRGKQKTGLLTTPIWQYWKTIPAQSANIHPVLGFSDGGLALVQQRVGRGEVIVMTTDPSPTSATADNSLPWSALVTWKNFAPLVQQMLASAITGRYENRNVQVGREIMGRTEQIVHNATVTLVPPPPTFEGARPAGRRIRLKVEEGASSWVDTNVPYSGMYEAIYEEGEPAAQFYAANIDPAESNLVRFDADLLPEALRQGSPAEEASAAASLPSSRSRSYFRLLLGLLLGLLLVETLLAWRFGSRT